MRRLFVYRAYLQVWPLSEFSVQFATEFTSRAAPRTVLHAAAASAAPIKSTVAVFWNMICPPLRLNETRLPAKRSIPAAQFSVQLSANRRQTAMGAEMWGCGS